MSDLKNLKGKGFTQVTIKYKQFEGSDGDEHAVAMKDLCAPWNDRDAANALEKTWRPGSFNRVLGDPSADDAPFKVQRRKVPAGSGQVKIEWTVWTDARTMLKPRETEHYAAMRAEEYYIGKGLKKTASKYFALVGPMKIPSDNLGIDNFFVDKGTGNYVVCESKFTSDEGVFNDFKAWQSDASKKKRAWQRLGPYEIRGRVVRQMSWKWIEDRAEKAMDSKVGIKAKMSPEEKNAVIDEKIDMWQAVTHAKASVQRVLNFYGSAKVPVLPGIYKFRAAARWKLAENQREYTWTLDIEPAEFLPLDDDFDKWCKEH